MYDGAAGKGVHLLINGNIDKCREIAQQMKTYNSYRIESVSAAMQTVDELLEKRGNDPGYPVLLYVPDISEGIIGILSGKVEERYNSPCGIFTDSAEGILKGSFRSPENYNIKDHLDMISTEFIGYGGHEGAGAGSVRKDNFDHMCQALIAVSKKPENNALDSDVYYYDIEINDRDVAKAIDENIAFAPFGNGNPDLIFKVTGFDVIPDYGGYKKPIGSNGVRLKSPFTTAVGFGLWDQVEIDSPCRITLYGTIADNFFNGNHYPQILFEHYELETNQTTTFTQKVADKARNRYN